MATIKEEGEKYRKLCLMDYNNTDWKSVNNSLIKEYGLTKFLSIKRYAWKQLKVVK